MQNPEHLRPTCAEQTVILLAEDDVIVQNIARMVLESEGYFILTAEDGEEALSLSRKYPGSIHLLLSDVRMPKMDGITLKQQIEVERPSTKVLLMSGEMPQCSGAHFLHKPFTPAVLRRKLREIIDNPVLLPIVRDVRETEQDPHVD